MGTVSLLAHSGSKVAPSTYFPKATQYFRFVQILAPPLISAPHGFCSPLLLLSRLIPLHLGFLHSAS